MTLLGWNLLVWPCRADPSQVSWTTTRTDFRARVGRIAVIIDE
jgi:hypothetical protein